MVVYVNGVDLAYYYFGYVPNRPANIVALSIFAVLFILLMIRILRSRSPNVFYLLPFTAILEVVGFVLRLVVANNPTTGTFTGMTVLLLISANVMTITNYKAAGDIILLSDIEARYGIIGPKFTNWFIKSNVLASIFQIIGGSMQSGSSNQTGRILALVGCCLQVVFFCFFILCALYIRNCKDYGYYINGQNPKTKVLSVVIASMLCIVVRAVYRLQNSAEIAANGTSDKEWAFYVFDSLMIAISLGIHFVFFIGNSFPLAGDTKEPANRITESYQV